MTSAQVNQLLHAIEGDHVIAFFLVLARVGPLFALAPLFSSKQLPGQVRTVVAVGLSIGLVGVAAHGVKLPTGAWQIALLFVEQLLVGVALAFALAVVFAALEMAGTLIDTVSGFSFGSLINPLTGAAGGAVNRIYTIVGTLIFIALGGEAWILRGIARTFQIVPLGSAPHIKPLVGGAVQAFDNLFVAAIEVAGPVLLALLITDIAFGMVSRVVPQLNVFAVGLPVKVGVALLLCAATLPFLGGWLTGQVYNALGTTMRELAAV